MNQNQMDAALGVYEATIRNTEEHMAAPTLPEIEEQSAEYYDSPIKPMKPMGGNERNDSLRE
jgi:hypothetical protein